nr:MAG TPA: hypothetical protein [Caudoviricetes sp.]
MYFRASSRVIRLTPFLSSIVHFKTYVRLFQ